MEGFTPLSVDLEITDGAWHQHLGDDPLHGRIEGVGVIPDGTNQHKPSFALRGHTDDGTPVVLETTWALMRTATRALEARYPLTED